MLSRRHDITCPSPAHTSVRQSSHETRADRRPETMSDNHDPLSLFDASTISRHGVRIDVIPDRLCIPEKPALGGCTRRVAVSSVIYRYHITFERWKRYQCDDRWTRDYPRVKDLTRRACLKRPCMIVRDEVLRDSSPEGTRQVALGFASKTFKGPAYVTMKVDDGISCPKTRFKDLFIQGTQRGEQCLLRFRVSMV